MADLKTHLSRYLARARDGHAIEVTAHRKPIARITGIPDQARGGVARMIAEGKASWSPGSRPTFEPVNLPDGGPPVSEIVLEDRGPPD